MSAYYVVGLHQCIYFSFVLIFGFMSFDSLVIYCLIQ